MRTDDVWQIISRQRLRTNQADGGVSVSQFSLCTFNAHYFFFSFDNHYH